MDYYPVEKCLQVLFERLMHLSPVQSCQLRDISLALLLAGQPSLSKIARQLARPTQQASRVQWVRRLLDAPFLSQERVYQPFIRRLLATYQSKTLHLLIDRTNLIDHERDLLCISLYFHRRSLPIAWILIPHSMTGYERQKALIDDSLSLLPTEKMIVFHGDNEFGGVPTMKYVHSLGWDFILAQASNIYYRQRPDGLPARLDTLPVTSQQAVYLKRIELTKRHWYGAVNLFAFYHPVYHRNRRKQDIRYYATSLPITPHLRRIGRHRWGIECYFKDLKSSGWALPTSCLRHPKRHESLLILLNILYSWLTCLGRWLSKTSRRYLIDCHPHRHLSLFRIGYDWLVHTFRCDGLVPVLTTLYR